MKNHTGDVLNWRNSLLTTAGMVTVIGPLAVCMLNAPRLRAQAAPPPTFDIASIKSNKAGDGVVMISAPPGGKLSAVGYTVRMLLQAAYQVQDFQLIGGAAWLGSERYNVDAKAAGNASKEQVRLMLQSLLADRFQMKLHRETRELAVYELVVERNGTKLKEAHCTGTPSPRNPCGGSSVDERGELITRAAPISLLAAKLQTLTGRTVLDKTGLMGNYDVDLEWTPDERILRGPGDPGPATAAQDHPSIFTAVQEQLGLKLQSAKGPVEVLVIDYAERPSAN